MEAHFNVNEVAFASEWCGQNAKRRAIAYLSNGTQFPFTDYVPVDGSNDNLIDLEGISTPGSGTSKRLRVACAYIVAIEYFEG